MKTAIVYHHLGPFGIGGGQKKGRSTSGVAGHPGDVRSATTEVERRPSVQRGLVQCVRGTHVCTSVDRPNKQFSRKPTVRLAGKVAFVLQMHCLHGLLKIDNQ